MKISSATNVHEIAGVGRMADSFDIIIPTAGSIVAGIGDLALRLSYAATHTA